MSLTLIYMVSTAAPFIQANTLYPNNNSAQEVANAINSAGITPSAKVNTVRVDASTVPQGPIEGVYMLISNSPSTGIPVFYKSSTSAQEMARSLQSSNIKTKVAYVRVPASCVTN